MPSSKETYQKEIAAIRQHLTQHLIKTHQMPASNEGNFNISVTNGALTIASTTQSWDEVIHFNPDLTDSIAEAICTMALPTDIRASLSYPPYRLFPSQETEPYITEEIDGNQSEKVIAQTAAGDYTLVLLAGPTGWKQPLTVVDTEGRNTDYELGPTASLQGREIRYHHVEKPVSGADISKVNIRFIAYLNLKGTSAGSRSEKQLDSIRHAAMCLLQQTLKARNAKRQGFSWLAPDTPLQNISQSGYGAGPWPKPPATSIRNGREILTPENAARMQLPNSPAQMSIMEALGNLTPELLRIVTPVNNRERETAENYIKVRSVRIRFQDGRTVNASPEPDTPQRIPASAFGIATAIDLFADIFDAQDKIINSLTVPADFYSDHDGPDRQLTALKADRLEGRPQDLSYLASLIEVPDPTAGAGYELPIRGREAEYHTLLELRKLAEATALLQGETAAQEKVEEILSRYRGYLLQNIGN